MCWQHHKLSTSDLKVGEHLLLRVLGVWFRYMLCLGVHPVELLKAGQVILQLPVRGMLIVLCKKSIPGCQEPNVSVLNR